MQSATDQIVDQERLSLVRAKGKFDQWGHYHYLSDTTGPYLNRSAGKPEKALGGLAHLFPVHWFSSMAEGPTVAAGLDEAAVDLIGRSTFEDVYVGGRAMKALVPTALATNDFGRFVALAVASGRAPLQDPEPLKLWTADMARDFSADSLRGPDMVERGMMGSGYTDCTLPSDGSAQIEQAWINLSDGSRLIGWVMCWFNR